MNLKGFAQLLLASVLVTVLCLSARSPAQAQTDPRQRIVAALDYNQSDVREVLRSLFSTAAVNYIISPEVQGTVSISLRNVTFESALQNILNQVNATYRVESGVWNIVRRQQGVEIGPSSTIGLNFQQADVRQALRELFKRGGANYSIDPMVQGTVSVSLQNVTFETALQNLTRQVDATYRMENGIYQVVRQDSGIRPGSDSNVQTIEPRAPETVVTQDAKYLYIVRGNAMFKVQKSDMKVVGRGTLP